MTLVSEINNIHDVDRTIDHYLNTGNESEHTLADKMHALLKIQPITKTISIYQFFK